MDKFLGLNGADQSSGQWPVIEVKYLVEEKPGSSTKFFSPEIVSYIVWDHGSHAFTRDGNEVYWAVVFEDDQGMLMTMKREHDRWGEIKSIPFTKLRFLDVDRIMSDDEKRHIFTSYRPVVENGKVGEYNLWVSDRDNGNWAEPCLLAPGIAYRIIIDFKFQY